MTLYYSDSSNRVTIYHGDALSVPNVGSADLLVTDPPYARAGALHTGRSGRGRIAADARGSDQFWLHWFTAVMARILPMVHPSGAGFVFCDHRTIHLVEEAVAASGTDWAVTQALVWDRRATGLGSPFRASFEMIAFLRGPAFQWTGSRSLRNVMVCPWPYGEHKHHPAEKPVALIEDLIREFTQPNDTVLDPFMGSGSTLRAAQSLSCRAVGIEIEERYCEIAAKRMGQEVLAL